MMLYDVGHQVILSVQANLEFYLVILSGVVRVMMVDEAFSSFQDKLSPCFAVYPHLMVRETVCDVVLCLPQTAFSSVSA